MSERTDTEVEPVQSRPLMRGPESRPFHARGPRKVRRRAALAVLIAVPFVAAVTVTVNGLRNRPGSSRPLNQSPILTQGRSKTSLSEIRRRTPHN